MVPQTLSSWLVGLVLTGSVLAQGASPPPEAAPAKTSGLRTEKKVIASEALKDDVSVQVHLPAGYDEDAERRYPVIYFLHGAGRGNESTWSDRGTNRTLERLVEAGKMPPCIVVCPRARRSSFYVNWKTGEGERHGDFVTDELPAWTDKHYRTIPKREFRGLSGDSMGGFGAVVNGFRKPMVFGSIAAHSPAIYPEDREKLPMWVSGGRNGGLLTRIFGDPIDEAWWLSHNPFHLAKTTDPEALKGLKIYVDVGKEDRLGLGETCNSWHALMTERKIPHEFHLREGGHGRDFFADNVASSLLFHGQQFRTAETAAHAPK